MPSLKLEILDYADAQTSILRNRWPNVKKIDREVTEKAKIIVDDVVKRGDAALLDYTEKFDGVKLPANRINVEKDDIEKAYRKVGKEQVSAIKFIKKRVEKFQKKILKRLVFEYEANGIRIRSCTSPIRRLGCYVPGGAASYPSSLVMTVTPAKVAGVSEVAVFSPPRTMGEINPLILVAADICCVDEIYRVGGAQAIAAMAYGTQTIRPVDKIVGPGNKFVVAAKMLVSKDLPIDIPAGSSEIVVLADESADTQIVALDLVSQSEHMDGVAVLVTTSKKVAESVRTELQKAIEKVPNRELVSRNLVKNSFIIICKTIEEAIDFINKYAPEHLEIFSADGWKIAGQIDSAGLVLVGRYSPVAASDYCFGTVHVLPTEGFSHVYSGLSVLDFVKRFNVIECSRQGLSEIRKPLTAMANAEGLLNHALAVEGRFKGE
ncbi:histidinol dehydrogenase [Candidatus Bathyarchaeota archaeon]|nr:histidinol dehydrogenase [Candidatus Bathyarchaeota archaeon]